MDRPPHPHRPSRLAQAALLAITLVAGAARAARADPPSPAGPIIPPGREAAITALLSDVGFDTPLEGGYRWRSARIDRSTVTFELARETAPGTWTAEATLTLSPRPSADATPTATPPPGTSPLSAPRVSPSFVLDAASTSTDPRVPALLTAAARSIVTHDRGDVYAAPPPEPAPRAAPVEPPHAPAPRSPLLLLLVAALLLPAALLRPRSRPGESVELKLTHALPATLQLCLYAYWSLYWPGVAAYAPYIAAQLGFAYALDALLQLRKHRRWRPTLAPLPIVLSLNLFAQWPFDAFHAQLQLGAVALALLSKDFLRRDGHHVFNPSAFALAVVGAVELVAFEPWSRANVSVQFNLPPNMTELVLLLGLVVQVRLRVVLSTLGAAVGLLVARAALGYPAWVPFWSPITLVLVLLITDPATSPRTRPGRALYGLFIGALLAVCDRALDAAGADDFFGKVLPLPAANALVPWFDAVGERLPGRLRGWLDPRHDRRHLAAWLLLALLDVGGDKRGAFDARAHLANDTPGLVREPDGTVTHAGNPMFCEPFSVAREVRFWRSRHASRAGVSLPSETAASRRAEPRPAR